MTILNSQSRENKKAHILRGLNLIPAELYGPDVDNQHLALNYNEFAKVYNEAGESSLVELKAPDGKLYSILIGEVELHSINGRYAHVDLRQVSMTEKIEADIELEFVGEAPAVKGLGGTFVAVKNSLTIKALPKDLVSLLTVDISSLATFSDKITVGDIALPAGTEAVDEPETLIASVSEPAQEETAPVVSEAEAVAAVEVEAGKKEEGEEAESSGKKAE